MAKKRRNISLEQKYFDGLDALAAADDRDINYFVNKALGNLPEMKKILGKGDKPVKTKRFTKPDYSQLVQAFWSSGQLKDYTEAEQLANTFLNHYDGNGWKVGRNAMKDWQAKVREWLDRRKENGSSNGSQQGNQHPRKQSLAERSAESSGRMDTYIAALEKNEASMGSVNEVVSTQMDF